MPLGEPGTRYRKEGILSGLNAQRMRQVPRCPWCGNSDTARLDQERRICRFCGRVSIAEFSVEREVGVSDSRRTVVVVETKRAS